ncbi:MAG: outer rane chaperone Skp (OmpH) [Firmicutes bacterium]|nr:outer rane chaperone Skp (OmpH) [Bacillota bacterium]
MLKMKKMVTVMLVLAAFAMTAMISGCSSSSSGIGVVDINKVMTESPKVKQLQEQLNATGKTMSEQLEKEQSSSTPEEFQKKQEKAYTEFMKAKQELEGQVDASLKQALQQIAKEKNLGVILYKNGVAQGGIDITDDVKQKMQ